MSNAITGMTSEELFATCQNHEHIGGGFILVYNNFSGEWQASFNFIIGMDYLENLVSGFGNTKEEAMINLLDRTKLKYGEQQ